MNTRLIHKIISFVSALAILSVTLAGTVSTVQAAGYVSQPSNRVVLNFNTHWLFAGDLPGANGQAVSLDESVFVPVTLPYFRVHPHKAFPKTAFEVPVSWYRRHFSLPSAYAGRRVYVEFQAVAKVADVYVNGTWVGQHKGAYTPFTFDITNLVTIGGADNVIAVKVNSTTRNDIPPEGGAIDYYVWGGIVRDVNLIVADPLHVDWVFITTPSVSTGSASVNARTNIRNDSSVAKSVTVTTSVVDAANNVVATGSATATIAANSTREFNYNTTTVSNPNLWHPDNPYLYTVYTQVQDGSTFVDEHKVRIGIRSIQFNKTDGKFYINGQWLKLRGLDRHESYPYIGRAAPNRLQAKDADMLKYELGINMMRMSHYPQDPEFLDRADEIGLLVLEEIPGWNFIGNTSWQDISVENVREMVMRDRNHPSIVIWGVRINESGDNHTFYTRTNDLARQLDPSRPTGGVRNFRTSEFLEDVYTYNDFSGGAEDPDPARMPWLITESVGHTRPNRAWDPETTLISPLTTHLNVQNQAAQKTNIAGALGWVFADYNTTFDSDSCFDFTCYHGVYDIFRLPKFSASAFASQRDPARYGPYISINNYHMSTSPTTVYVGGNCNQVELFANGVSQGRINPNAYTSLPHPFFQFNNVTTASGSLRADCWIGGSVVATTTRYTPGTATRLVLTPDDAALQADGADMTRVVVQALDANNQVVPYNAANVSFSVSGPGTVIGGPLTLEAGRGAVYVKAALGETGTVSLSASAAGLTGASASVAVDPFTAEIVPPSGSYSFGFVTDVNDATQGSGLNQFNYAGSWQHGGCEGGCFNIDNSWSNVANDTVTLAFNGTRVVLYGVLDPGHGSGAVSIDGGSETTVNFNSGTRRGNVALWSSPALVPGNHTLRVRVIGNGYVVLDRAMVVRATSSGPTPTSTPTNTPTPTATPGGTITVDDRVTGTGQNQFNYSGAGWQSCTNCGADLYAGTNSWDNTTNDSVTVAFTGTQIKFYGVKDPGHGIGAVSIDGGSETNIDFYAAPRAGGQLLWTSPVLSNGSHTFKLRITGTKNASSSNTWVVADRVDILTSSGPTNTPTRTPTPTTGPSATPTNTPTPTATSQTGTNLALNKTATGSASCNSSETPPKAVNGSWTGGNTDKWCDNVSASKWLQVDLGANFNVNQFVIRHAGAGGESTTFNTRDFNLQVSTNGTSWTTVVTVTANIASTTTHNIPATTARYVRLNVTAGTQGTSTTARIYEVEVYGASSPTPTPTNTPPPVSNLALNKPATASASCNANEGPEKAVNGSWTGGNSDKWCDNTSTSKWLQVDLGANFNVSQFVVRHAGAGGESIDWNTRDFNIQVSTDGVNWTTVVTVSGNTASTTMHNITTTTARYVRLNVITPTQTTDTAARIYELEVYGN